MGSGRRRTQTGSKRYTAQCQLPTCHAYYFVEIFIIFVSGFSWHDLSLHTVSTVTHGGHNVMEPGVSNGAEEARNDNPPYITNSKRREYKEWFKA